MRIVQWKNCADTQNHFYFFDRSECTNIYIYIEAWKITLSQNWISHNRVRRLVLPNKQIERKMSIKSSGLHAVEDAFQHLHIRTHTSRSIDTYSKLFFLSFSLSLSFSFSPWLKCIPAAATNSSVENDFFVCLHKTKSCCRALKICTVYNEPLNAVCGFLTWSAENKTIETFTLLVIWNNVWTHTSERGSERREWAL